MEDAGDGPPLPSNYLTFLHLKQRWLQQQSATSNKESDPQSTQKPVDDDASTSKSPIESFVHPTINHHHNRVINQRKPDVTLHDSASKTPKQVIPHRRNHHRVVNQIKPEANSDDSSSASKTVVQVADDYPVVEKKDKNTNQSNSKPSTTKNSSRRQNPRVVTDQIPTGGSTGVKPEKKKHRNRSGRRNRNRSQELREPKGETPPRVPVVDAVSHNGACGGSGVVEADAAAVKEINVGDGSRRTDRRWSSARFYGGARNGPARPLPSAVKKGQTTTTIWVKKGESASN